MLVHERSSSAVVAIAIVWQSHHAIALLKHVQWSINVVYVCVCKRANFNFTMYRIGEDMHGVNNESEQFFFKHFHVLNILPWIYFVVQKEGVNVHQKTGIPSWVCKQLLQGFNLWFVKLHTNSLLLSNIWRHKFFPLQDFSLFENRKMGLVKSEKKCGIDFRGFEPENVIESFWWEV